MICDELNLNEEGESDMQMLVNGVWCDALDGEVIEVVNPFDGKKLGTVPRAKAADVELAVAAAKLGYEINRAIPARGGDKSLWGNDNSACMGVWHCAGSCIIGDRSDAIVTAHGQSGAAPE